MSLKLLVKVVRVEVAEVETTVGIILCCVLVVVFCVKSDFKINAVWKMV